MQITKFERKKSLHDDLQGYWLTKADRSALAGRFAGTTKQLSIKAIMEIQNFLFPWLLISITLTYFIPREALINGEGCKIEQTGRVEIFFTT